MAASQSSYRLHLYRLISVTEYFLDDSVHTLTLYDVDIVKTFDKFIACLWIT